MDSYEISKINEWVGKFKGLPFLKEDNARQGFFENHEYENVFNCLPEPLNHITQYAYLSGWRKAEIVSLKWGQVDRIGGEVRLKTSKSGHGRVLPLEGLLADLIEERWQAREVTLKNGETFLSQFVFHRNGMEIRRFDKAWRNACEKAGYPGKLFHDLRRTAVRNMIRAGAPQSVAMAISGHRTIHTFLRYNITSEEDKKKVLLDTQKHVENLDTEKKVINLHGKK